MLEIPFKYGNIVWTGANTPKKYQIQEFGDFADFIFDENVRSGNDISDHIDVKEIVRTGKFITYGTIMKIVFDYFHVPINHPNQRRTGILVKARQFSIYFGHKYTKLSLVRLGEPFEKDHATVLYAINKIDNLAFRTNEKQFEVINDVKLIEDKIINSKII